MSRTLSVLIIAILVAGSVSATEKTFDTESDWEEGERTNITVNGSEIHLDYFFDAWSYSESPGISRKVNDMGRNGSRVYALVEGQNKIIEFDGDTGTVLDTVSIPVVEENRFVTGRKSLSANLDEIFVSSEDKVRRINLETLDENTTDFPISNGSGTIGPVEANNDNVWFFQNGALLEYSFDGDFREQNSSFNDVQALESEKNVLWIGDQDRLYVSLSVKPFGSGKKLQGTIQDIEVDFEGSDELVYVLTTGRKPRENNLYKFDTSLNEEWKSSAHTENARSLAVRDSGAFTVAGGSDNTVKKYNKSTGEVEVSYDVSRLEGSGVKPTAVMGFTDGIIVGFEEDLKGFKVEKISPEYAERGSYRSKPFDTNDRAHNYDYFRIGGDLEGQSVEVNVSTSRNKNFDGSNTYNDVETVTSSGTYDLSGLKDRWLRFNLSFGRASETSSPTVDNITFGYFDEPPPDINLLEPSDGTSTSDPTTVEVEVDDPDGDTLTVNITDESGKELKSKTVSGTGTVTAEYSNPDKSSENKFTVNVSKGNVNFVREFSFSYNVPVDPERVAAEVNLDSNYTSVIGSSRTTQLVQMYVRNPSETDTRTYDLSLSTENSAITPTFQSSGTQNLEVDVNPGSRKSVLMQVPTRKTDTVKIDVTDQASGISRSVSFDVQPVEKQTTEVRNVPGIGVLQVFVAGLVATAYSLLL